MRVLVLLAGVIAARQTYAATPHAALATKPVAAFTEVASKKGFAKILYYKNEDVLKTTATTVKTPIYTTVITPVYSIVKTPILDSKGKTTGYKSVSVQTGTTTSQKLTGYNSVTTKSTAITPKASLYTTNGSSTAAAATPVKFSLDVANTPFAQRLSGMQDALFTFSAVSTKAPTLDAGHFTQIFDSGTLSFTRTTPIYRLNALGQAYGPALSNLLTITFSNATLTAAQNGMTMGFAATTPAATINFTSDFRQFTKTDWLSNFDFALAGDAASTKMTLAAVDPTLTNVTGARSLGSFRVATTGTFAASDVPEPASWVMMLLGFGVIGFAGRADVRRFARAAI